MKSRDIFFLLGVLAVVGVLYWLSATAKKPPAIPPDAVHVAVTTIEGCKECHGKGKPNEMKVHPPKDQCFECHKYNEGGHGVMG